MHAIVITVVVTGTLNDTLVGSCVCHNIIYSSRNINMPLRCSLSVFSMRK